MKRVAAVALVLAAGHAALAAPTATPATHARPALLAGGPGGAAFLPLGEGDRVELPWLLPGDADLAVAPDGRRLAFSSARSGEPELYVADAATGSVTRLTFNPRSADRHPAWSPDGRTLAWSSGRAGSADLHLMRADGTRKQRLAATQGDDVEPAWSPDGRTVAFASGRAGRYTLWTVRRGGEPSRLEEVAGGSRDPAYAPGGRRLAYTRHGSGGADVVVLDLGTGRARALRATPAFDGRPSWSPDGRLVAFASTAGGRLRTWVVRADGRSARPLAAARAGDGDPTWATATAALVPPADALVPDLDQRPPAGLAVLQRAWRWHLGFDSAVESVGRGPVVLRGRRAAGEAHMRAEQLLERRGGREAVVVPHAGRLRYEAHPPHRHWHYQPFERYELRRSSDFSLVARDRKTGFCLIDRYGTARGRSLGRFGPPRFVSDCAAGRPDAREVVEGSSVGYRDRYPAFFHGQDLDLTGVPAGRYWLVHRANPDRLLRELTYANNAAALLVDLRWTDGVPSVRTLRTCEHAERCS